MQDALDKYEIPWMNCFRIAVDMSVNMSCRNLRHIQRVNVAIYVMEYPCHVVHNIAGKPS